MERNIVILTGAGISAESGLQTFRAEDGLWCDHRVEDVATPEAYARDPALVQRFYNMRRSQLKDVEPNAAHHALAELVIKNHGEVLIVTQNVDDLHERAWEAVCPHPNPLPEGEGTRMNPLPLGEDGERADTSVQRVAGEGCSHLIHMHGELLKARHNHSGEVREQRDDLAADDEWRPHIVWFGEMPFEMERIYDALRDCDLFMSIGTSGNVYPAAGFVFEAGRCGADTVELNLEPSAGATLFNRQIYGPASKVVPEFVKRLI